MGGGAYWRGRLLNFFFSRGGGGLLEGGTYWRGALIKLFLFQGGRGRLLEGALKRGWALIRGFTVLVKLITCEILTA